MIVIVWLAFNFIGCGADYYKQKRVNQNKIKEQQEKRGAQRDELTVIHSTVWW